MVQAAPATPAITASSRARPPHSTKLCTATAATSAATTSPAAAVATGHIPLPEPDEQQREERPRDQAVHHPRGLPARGGSLRRLPATRAGRDAHDGRQRQ